MVFSWRLLKDRIPVKKNLVRRQILLKEEALYVFCGVNEESTEHLFTRCQWSSKIWMHVLDWVGISTALHRDCSLHFQQFRDLFSNCKKRKEAWVVIWHSTVWSVWLRRNKLIFKSDLESEADTLQLIKWRAWWWLRSKYKGFSYPLCSWEFNPSSCLL